MLECCQPIFLDFEKFVQDNSLLDKSCAFVKLVRYIATSANAVSWKNHQVGDAVIVKVRVY